MEVKETPPKKAKLQYGIHKFFGSFEQKEEAKPVLLEAPIPYARKAKSKAQLDLEAAQAALEQQWAEREAEDNPQAVVEMSKRKRLNQGGKLFVSPKELQKPRRPQQGRLELTALRKHIIAQDLKKHEPEYADRESFWRDMSKRYGMRSDQLREILRRADEWKPLSQKPLAEGSSKNKRRRRKAGAGRKTPFQDLLPAFKTWLSLERASSHTITKTDVLAEFLCRLRQSAKKLQDEAVKPGLSALQKQELLQEAKVREERAQKLVETKTYKRSFTEKLLKWIGAKWTTSEVVSNISTLETKVRCQLTWQEFDKTLWLASLATQAELSETQKLSDTKAFIKARPDLVVGFSDQVPLWAKASGRKAVFAEEELFDKDQTKDFSEVREAISEVLAENKQADFQVVPLTTPRKSTSSGSLSLSKQASKDSLGTPATESEATPGPKRKLSFDNPSPEGNAMVEAEAAAEPEKDDVNEAAEEQAKPPLPKAGAKTTLGFSADERFRITYEARQLLFNICGKPEEPVRGAAGKGLLVVPGQWARLSNIDLAGKWIKTEVFSVGSKVITHLAGTSAGRALEAYRKLRAAEPELVAEVDIMSQPAANVDSVILTWVVQGQAEEFPATVCPQFLLRHPLRPWLWLTNSLAW